MREIAHNKTVLVHTIAFFSTSTVCTVISMATSYDRLWASTRPNWCWLCSLRSLWPFRPPSSTASLLVACGTLNTHLGGRRHMGIVRLCRVLPRPPLSFGCLPFWSACFQGGVQLSQPSGRIIPAKSPTSTTALISLAAMQVSRAPFLVSVVTSLTGNAGRPVYRRAGGGL